MRETEVLWLRIHRDRGIEAAAAMRVAPAWLKAFSDPRFDALLHRMNQPG